MSGKRVSRLPSLKAPSPATSGHSAASNNVSPAPSSAGQARSRRTSLSSNENGSLTRDAARDVTLSDFAFVEQLEDFRRQLLDLRKDKKKLEDEIIKYKLLCKEKHQSIQELNNKLEAEKANYYDLREQLTRDLTLQLNNQHASDKKKLSFDMSILKNDNRKLESEIRLLETTNKGLFEEIRQIRGSYDSKMEKLMKDFHIEIYKESGEKRRLEKKLAHTNEKLTKEEYLSRQAELEKERAEDEAKGAKTRRTSTFGSDIGTLDRQNKKIAELEETIRKLESIKTIAESQNLELMRKMKDAERGNKRRSFTRQDTEPKESPVADRKRSLNKTTSRDKIEAADKRISKMGTTTKKDLEQYLKLANKERNVLERKLALLEKTREKTGGEGIDNEIALLREQHRNLRESVRQKERLLQSLETQLEEAEEQLEKRPTDLELEKKQPGLEPPRSRIPRSPRSDRKSRSPSPSPRNFIDEKGDAEKSKNTSLLRKPNSFREKKKDPTEKSKIKEKCDKKTIEFSDLGPEESRKLREEIEKAIMKDEESRGIIRIDRTKYIPREQQTSGQNNAARANSGETRDEGVQCEFYNEEEDGMFDDLQDLDGGGGFMFQEPAAPDPTLGVHSTDTVLHEYEEKLSGLQRLRENDMEKIASLSDMIEQYKCEVASLRRKAGSYYSELEASGDKLNSSVVEIEKLTGELRDLKELNTSLAQCDTMSDSIASGEVEKELQDSRKQVEQLTCDLREKQLTVMKLHQELHEATEQVMDKSGLVRQLEALVENLKHDQGIMREEQANFETTTEEVLDQLRCARVKNNQLEELVRTLEGDAENHKRDITRLSEEQTGLQGDKERLEVESEQLANKMAARDRELETVLSGNPETESGAATLDLLQEIRQKDYTIKKQQKKHNDTIAAVKKEVEKQVTQLQTKVSRKDDDIAHLNSVHNQEKSDLVDQIATLRGELHGIRDSLREKDQELKEVYTAASSTPRAPGDNELNKRLAELANENMALKDEMAYLRAERGVSKRTNGKNPVTICEEGASDDSDSEGDVGEISVALVLYCYDPDTMSPNEYPEDELPLQSGDFVYVFGEPDEDGFYTAELMSGQRGLVPSNFIQTVDMTEKKTHQMRRVSVSQRLSTIPPPHLDSPGTPNKDVPVPEELRGKSIGESTVELSWELPDNRPLLPVVGFRVLLNKRQFKVTSTGECRTILADLPDSRPLYFTLRTISSLGESSQSRPFIYGRDPIQAPESVDITNITANSAVITFVGQPHYHHALALNNMHRAVLNPGEFLYSLRGLSHESDYEIRISALESDRPSLHANPHHHTSSFSTSSQGEWTPESPPPSVLHTRGDELSAPGDLRLQLPAPGDLRLQLPAPGDLRLAILDQDKIEISWGSVTGAQCYLVHLNNRVERTVDADSVLSVEFQIRDLHGDADEQCFHVEARGESQITSGLPSDTISFFKSELLAQLSTFFTEPDLLPPSPDPSECSASDFPPPDCASANCDPTDPYLDCTPTNCAPSPDPSESGFLDYSPSSNSKSPSSDSPPTPDTDPEFPVELASQLLLRVAAKIPALPDMLPGQIVSAQLGPHGDYTARVGGSDYHIPAHCVSLVPVVRRVVALYAYQPTAMSPNQDHQCELTFATGDVILIYGQDTESGFLKGILDNRAGLVPSNFVIDLEAVLDARTALEHSQNREIKPCELPTSRQPVSSV